MARAHSPSAEETVELSIVVPVFNSVRYLPECVESILGQSFTDFELLLVNDGSTDGSAQLLEEFAERDTRVRVFHRENEGPSAARNYGLRQARGVYVQFVDSDDVLEPECCQTFSKTMRSGAPDLLVCGASIRDRHMAMVQTIAMPGTGLHGAGELLESLRPATKATLLHYVWNKWYRLSLIGELDLQFDVDIRLGEDFLFNCAYWEHCQTVGLINEELYRYCRRTDDSLTRRFRPDELTRRRKMDARMIALYERFGLRERCDLKLQALLGSITLDSLSSVVLEDCQLPWRDRVDHIGDFVASEYREYIGVFAASDGVSAVGRLEAALVMLRAPLALYLLIWFVSRGRKVRDSLARLVRRTRDGAAHEGLGDA